MTNKIKSLGLFIASALSLQLAHAEPKPNDTLSTQSTATTAQVHESVGYPKSTNKYVNDFATTIDQVDANKIKHSLESLEDQTGIEVCIVTINSIQDYQGTETNFEKFATGLFNNWGIGKKETNNGILFLIAVKDLKVRIELGSGYPTSHNSMTATIIAQDILPYFKQGQFSRGIYEGTQAILKNVAKEVSWFEYYKWHLLLWLLIVICIVVAISCFRSGKKGWGWFVLALIGGLLLLLWNMGSSNKSEGFGGGKSDGGGSSGSW